MFYPEKDLGDILLIGNHKLQNDRNGMILFKLKTCCVWNKEKKRQTKRQTLDYREHSDGPWRGGS